MKEVSLDIHFKMLQLLGQNPFRTDGTTVVLSNFTMDVGIPCSGLRLLLAVIAIVFFFILIAHLGLWKNVLLAVSILPLSLIVNGLRITMIGLVGNSFGSAAGASFHDYSGYISLVICFGILYKMTKSLGWK